MIKPLSLAKLCERFGGELLNGDCTFEEVVTDSRKSSQGALFIAIKGEHFDAHDFLDQVIEQGASALVIDRKSREKITNCPVPVWLVEDTVLALGHIAKAQRDNYRGVIFAITGSNGKTSVKGMLKDILCAAVGDSKVFATQGNFNNHLGVPFSLLAIDSQCEYAVIEMGASAIGEIDYVSEIAQPHYSLINNVSPAHVEGFGSVDNISIAKSEIYDHLHIDGCAVINADDHYAPQWFAKNKQRNTMSFSSRDAKADIFISSSSMNAQHCYCLTLNYKNQQITIQLGVLGEHAVMNAAAAASLALAAGIKLDAIKAGLECFNGVAGRLQVSKDAQANTLINDTYNASPNSMRVAIDTLAAYRDQKILIIGDMGELGESAQAEHETVGRYAKEKGINLLFTLGPLSQHAAICFGEGGFATETFDELMQAVTSHLTKPSCILVKGSRSAKMERAVHYLKHSGEADASLVS